jgi:4-amino-4-deoxy-L-arabinose transferase-like glycosyltransferase
VEIEMKRLEIGLLLTILMVAAFFRFWRLPEYMTFLGDEGRDVLVVRNMLLGRKYTLIGPGTSIGNMYLGPWYYYMLLVPLFAANFSPVGPAIFICILGLFTVALLWWIGRVWIGRWESLGLALLYAISPVVITYSRSSWNPNIMPFFALLTMYSLWVVWRYRRFSWLVVAAVSFALVLNSHYLGLLLLPTIIIFGILIFRRNFRLKSFKFSFALCVLTFALMLSPLVIFDLRHGGQNFAAMKTFFTDRQTTVNAKPYKALPHLWPIWTQINVSLLTAKNTNLAIFISSLSLISISILIIFRRRPQYFLIASWLGFGLLGLGLYKQHIYDHYFGFIFPAVFLGLGLVFRTLGKYLSFILFGLLVIINLQKNPFTSEPNRQLARTSQIADFIDRQSGGSPYNLALISPTNYDASYRYFLQLKPSPWYTIHDRLADQLFVVCEDPACQPINHPLWEVAAFGWAKIDQTWDFPWQVKVFKLVHNPGGS